MHPEELVYVVDDDAAVRASLDALLRASGYEARVYGSPEVFLGELGKATAGCVVTDLRMPGLSGLELQRRLHQAGHNLPIIFVTGFGDVPAAVRAIKDGAIDFLEKPIDSERLLERVGDALRADRARRETEHEAHEVNTRLGSLTPREREVMAEVAAGKANKVIAHDLGISERTVEVHRGNVMRKLGVRSAAELARIYERDCGEHGGAR